MTHYLRAVVLCLSAGSAIPAGAQVGYPPAKSPFLDVEQKHEITLVSGYLNAKRDPAKVAPQGGPLVGLQYEWRATGPVHLGGSLSVVNSSRNKIDPSQPSGSRSLGTPSDPLFAAETFLALSLTGERSWHQLMPMVGAGLGLISDFQEADAGGFRFGTRFAIPWSVGVRWLPGGGAFQLRADIKDWMYTIAYPQSYYLSAPPDPAVLSSDTKTSRWTNNFAMIVGVTYSFKR